MPADKRVLVAEDNDMNFMLVEFVLNKTGASVTRASTGQQVVEMSIAQCPHLIYMDIQLPGLDGIEATRQIRAHPLTCRVPIVALTALAMPGDEARALDAGCNAYLTKPVSPQLLKETTERWLGLAEKAGEAR